MFWRFTGPWFPAKPAEPKLTITAPADMVAKLDKLRAATRMDHVNLLRRALHFYEVAVEAVKAGKQIQVVSEDGDTKLIDLDLDLD
jgi:hypothetical protein